MLVRLLLSLALAWPVLAQEKDDSVRYALPEQTVTGTRVEQPWLNNATAITALTPADQPENRGLGISDNLLLVPGLVAMTRFGTDDMRLAMRGMGARSNSGVRGVRVLYDGIPESEPDGQTRLEGIEVGSLDRVEVLRGAGSAMYGNAAGGVVNLRTAETLPRAGVRADVTGGAYGYSKIKLSAGTGPAVLDTSITLSLNLHHMDLSADAGRHGAGGLISFSQTRTDGWREHSSYDGQIVSGSWSSHGDARTGVRAVFYFANVIAELPGTLNKAEFETDPMMANHTWDSLDVRRITRKGRIGLGFDHRFSDHWSFNFTPFAALKSLDRARENGQYQTITRYILGGTGHVLWKGEIADLESEMVAGTDVQFQDGPVSFYDNLQGTKGDILLSQESERQTGEGYFAQWEVENPERWGVSVGARYDRVTFLDDFLSDATPTARYAKSAVTPRAGLRYHPMHDVSVFGTVYGGFETPTLSESENTLGIDVKPQKTLTFEAGARSQHSLIGSHAHLEATFYRMTITDAIVPDKIAGEKLFTNAAEAVHQGIELSARLSRPKLGYIGFAASVGEFVFTDYKTGLGDFTDKKLPGVSPDMFSAIVRWEPRDVFFAELTARASGSAFANTDNTEKADGWAVLNAAVGGRIPVKAVSASWHFGVQNILDKTYVSFIQVNDSGKRYYESGMPRAVFGGISIGTPGI